MIRFPNDTKKYIDEIRKQVGRVVQYVYQDGFTECTYSGCSLDPTTGLSTNSFCPVCSGKHYIPVIKTSGILTHVTWNRIADEYLSPPGIDLVGQVRLQMEYTPEHEYIVSHLQYAIVDGKKVERRTHDFRGVPSINRIVIIGRQIDD